MQHPDLEAKLQELKEQREKTLEDFRDLASDAITNADRSNKTMMMFIPPGEQSACSCNGSEDHKCEKHKNRERRTLRLKKLKRKKE